MFITLTNDELELVNHILSIFSICLNDDELLEYTLLKFKKEKVNNDKSKLTIYSPYHSSTLTISTPAFDSKRLFTALKDNVEYDNAKFSNLKLYN